MRSLKLVSIDNYRYSDEKIVTKLMLVILNSMYKHYFMVFI